MKEALKILKKCLLVLTLVYFIPALFSFAHPFYLGVTDIKYNAKEKTLQASVKLFTNDFEEALKKATGKPVDLINGTNKDEIGKAIKEYITKHFSLKLNGKARAFNFIGYEREQEAVWIYIEFKNCEAPKKLEIENTLLYEQIKSQINIVKVEIGEKEKSLKCTNPEKKFEFQF